MRAKATDDTESSSAFSDTVTINIAQAVVGPISPKKSVIEKDDKNLELFKKSLQEMALIFLAPLLAIAIWFVLFQGGTTADYTWPPSASQQDSLYGRSLPGSFLSRRRPLPPNKWPRLEISHILCQISVLLLTY